MWTWSAMSKNLLTFASKDARSSGKTGIHGYIAFSLSILSSLSSTLQPYCLTCLPHLSAVLIVKLFFSSVTCFSLFISVLEKIAPCRDVLASQDAVDMHRYSGWGVKKVLQENFALFSEKYWFSIFLSPRTSKPMRWLHQPRPLPFPVLSKTNIILISKC